MPRVVPSQVVAFIDQVFPWAATQQEGKVVNLVLDNSRRQRVLNSDCPGQPTELLWRCGMQPSRDRVCNGLAG